MMVNVANFEKIRRSFKKNITSGMVVYFALCEIASEAGGSEFEVEQPYIAIKSGCCVRTVGRCLKSLIAIGLISVETPPLRQPCTYRLLT